MNNTDGARLKALETSVRRLTANLKKLNEDMRKLRTNNRTANRSSSTATKYPNNIKRGRFVARRWQNEYPGYSMDPR